MANTPYPVLDPLITRHSIAERNLDRLATALWIFDIDHSRVVWANQAALKVWQADSLEELTARDMGADMSVAVAQRLRQYQEDFIKYDSSFSEIWTLYPEDVPVNLDVVFQGYHFEDGRTGMLCEARTQRENTPEGLRSAEALLHTSVMISLFDLEGAPLYSNPAARASRADPTSTLNHHFVNAEDCEALLAELKQKGGCRQSVRVRTAKGVRWHEITARECLDAATGSRAFLLSEIDITDLKQTEQRVRYLADHDILTGLPNRNFVQSYVPEQIHVAREEARGITCLIIDLDHFKTINDTLGHAAGDEMLISVGRRLKEATADKGIVARLGGDEFLICLTEIHKPEDIDIFCTGLLERFEEQIIIENRTFLVTLSIGVSRFPDDGKDLDALLQHADFALYEAKENGRDTYRQFSFSLKNQIDKKVLLEQDLHRAFDNDEFELYYQPRLDAESNHIIGAEALLRWHHPTRGLLAAGTFIETCEQMGLINQLGEWILRQAAREQCALERDGYPISISINLSPEQFRSPRLKEIVLSLSDQTGCNPGKIELEITESMLMGTDNDLIEMLLAFRARGFGIAIDDFGTGYSNLAYIQQFPVTSLKIDRSFVNDIGKNTAITGLIISFCKVLGVKAVVEGVETRSQLDWLSTQGCNEYQGYLFSPAVTTTELRSLLDQSVKYQAQPLLVSQASSL